MTDAKSKFESICRHAREAMLLQTVADTLEWDERTGMPPAASEYRAEQVSTLRGTVHRLRTDPQYGEDLQRLAEDSLAEDRHGDQGATIHGLLRDWLRDCKLPTDLVQRISVATVKGQRTWDQARKANDYALFQGTLDHIVRLQREAGQRIAEGTDLSAYEALLDQYEPEMRVDQLQQMFDSVREPLVELIARVDQSAVRPDTSSLTQQYSIAKQREFCQRVTGNVGFDFNRGRLDETSHPFCTTLGPDDCRILTRFDAHWLPAGLMAALHEAGHGMYEQGLRREWFALPPGSYLSLGIHESQSRLWENQVGRSRAFWKWLYPQAQHTFSPQLDSVSLDSFYAAINQVTPSLIRVEADEATYNLHIIIRFDLERQLIDDTLSVADLPEAWNARYQHDLGIRPTGAADGVLQDVHWSAGLFGYFPTYTIGNLASAQFFDAAARELGNLDELIGRGEFEPLLDWLRRKVHHVGRCYNSAQLVQRATGGPPTADPLIHYLQSKLHPLYPV